MALHLNFYHEIQREAQARARDPVKLAGLAGAALAVLLLAYYGYRSYAVSRVEAKLASVQKEWKRLEPAQAEAKKREAELFVLQKSNKALVDRLHGRLYFAPLLDKIATATPPTVQITSLAADYADPEKPATVLVSGIAAGLQPRSAAEAFRLALEKEVSGQYPKATASFDANSLEEAEENIEWSGESLHTARFKIRLTLEGRPPAKEEAPPAPKKAKTK